MDMLFTAINAALFVGTLLAFTGCMRHANHVARRRKAFDDGMARLHAVKAQVTSLAEALDALGLQLAKLRGKFYASQAPAPRKPVTLDGEYVEDVAEVDPEIAAHIALQTAPAKAPGSR